MTRTDDDPPEWAKEQAREMMAAGGDEEVAADEASEPDPDDRAPDVPVEAVDEAERLTRLAREAESAEPTPEIEEAAAQYRERRDALAAEYGYTARVRDEDDALVLYPDEWMDDGTVQLDRIEDTDRAVEVPLSGTNGEDAWPEIEAHNADLVAAVADEHGAVHAANARAFADFMGNHYLARIESATADQVTEFIEEYYPRNAWASSAQREVVDASLEYVFGAADTGCPTGSAEFEN